MCEERILKKILNMKVKKEKRKRQTDIETGITGYERCHMEEGKTRTERIGEA
jgi:hypothetical protein